MDARFFAIFSFVLLTSVSYSYCSEPPYSESKKIAYLEYAKNESIDKLNDNDFSFKEKYLGYFKGKELALLSKDKELGSLSYLKIPLLQWYTLYCFYIHPEHRNSGYGRFLFQEVMDKVEKLGATKIMLQTGPYEYDDKGNMIHPKGEDRNECVEKLLKFYSSFGFKPLNKTLATLLAGVYKVLSIFDIHEDASIFMTMNPKQKQS